ncbi:hypothetical protein Tdes44962_MAKER09424 [Teratosphaeria destructans]|uniref:Uncharacterized protein n=1 Tax=Teratosphaeria destructans TaxID=418781 RepID=A0A9W7W3A3_9PEZI|nr:hypothetical protein Tdes44962_MAKER09424 [Teratosphaeria destructans]
MAENNNIPYGLLFLIATIAFLGSALFTVYCQSDLQKSVISLERELRSLEHRLGKCREKLPPLEGDITLAEDRLGSMERDIDQASAKANRVLAWMEAEQVQMVVRDVQGNMTQLWDSVDLVKRQIMWFLHILELNGASFGEDAVVPRRR